MGFTVMAGMIFRGLAGGVGRTSTFSRLISLGERSPNVVDAIIRNL